MTNIPKTPNQKTIDFNINFNANTTKSFRPAKSVNVS